MRFGWVEVAEAAGGLLAHRVPGSPLKKGQILSEADCRALAAAGVTRVQAAFFEAADVGEDQAATAAARAACGAHLSAQPASTGRVNLTADRPGLFQPDPAGIDRFNRLHEGLTLATLPTDAVCAAGQVVATVKVIPYALPQTVVQAAEKAVPCLTLAPFRPRASTILLGQNPGMKESLLDKAAQALAARLTPLGLAPAEIVIAEHDETALAEALRAARGAVLLLLGASATADRRDVAPAALTQAGGTLDHFGLPMDPGHLMLTGRLGDRPVLLLPGCARSPALNGVDRVLARLAADQPIDAGHLQGFGLGGLLKAYGRHTDTAAARPRTGAVVLAAGLSRRMGADPKLMLPWQDRPLIDHSLTSVADLDAVVAVVPPAPHPVTAHLAARPDLETVVNPQPAAGLGASLALGAQHLRDRVDRLLVLPGDMPAITADTVTALLKAADANPDRSIAFPVYRGRRGHPVLFDAAHLPALSALSGDEGARALLAAQGGQALAVPVGDPGVVRDVDDPAAYRALLSGQSAD